LKSVSHTMASLLWHFYYKFKLITSIDKWINRMTVYLFIRVTLGNVLVLVWRQSVVWDLMT